MFLIVHLLLLERIFSSRSLVSFGLNSCLGIGLRCVAILDAYTVAILVSCNRLSLQKEKKKIRLQVVTYGTFIWIEYLPFQFKYFNNTDLPKVNEPSAADLTRPDGNLELNIGKINIVFLYRFITELLVSVAYFEENVSVIEILFVSLNF